MIVKEFTQGDSYSWDYDPRKSRDDEAKKFKLEGYKVKRWCEVRDMYPPSTYPPRSYKYIHKRPTKVYCVKTVGRKRKLI